MAKSCWVVGAGHRFGMVEIRVPRVLRGGVCSTCESGDVRPSNSGSGLFAQVWSAAKTRTLESHEVQDVPVSPGSYLRSSASCTAAERWSFG